MVEPLWNRIRHEEFERLATLVLKRDIFVERITAELESEPPFLMSQTRWRGIPNKLVPVEIFACGRVRAHKIKDLGKGVRGHLRYKLWNCRGRFWHSHSITPNTNNILIYETIASLPGCIMAFEEH